MRFPALELVWTPTGIGSVVQGRGWAIGAVEPLPEQGLSFGIEGDVRLRWPAEPREICKVDRRGGKLRLWHALKRYHCVVNGLVLEDQEIELKHRDLIALPRGPLLRVLEEEIVTARSPSLEAAIREAPEDRELLRVYSDFLLDQADPLGERLARSRSSLAEDDATWLDVLAGHYESGALQIEWQHGLASKAVLRGALHAFASLEAALEHLSALPVMRFLRELTLELSTDNLSLVEGLAAVARVKLPETVKRLSFGALPIDEKTRADVLLKHVKRPIEVSFFSEAVLEIADITPRPGEPVQHKAGDRLAIGDRVELGRTGFVSALSHNVLLGGSHMIARDEARYELARLLNDSEPAKVNGRIVDRFPLREGDVIEIPGEMTAVFKLVR